MDFFPFSFSAALWARVASSSSLTLLEIPRDAREDGDQLGSRRNTVAFFTSPDACFQAASTRTGDSVGCEILKLIYSLSGGASGIGVVSGEEAGRSFVSRGLDTVSALPDSWVESSDDREMASAPMEIK